MTTTSPSVRIGDASYPVILPNLRDPRLHLAAVIISIHILGQVGLGFRVSVPQIAMAILTGALIEVWWTFQNSRMIVWPASGMLTGSGVALIFRLVDAQPGDHWTWEGWHVFALVAGLSLLTKYLIRFRGRHVFNPSNVGLVAAFLILGSARVEPLDFWWAPFGVWMAIAYLVILVGGLLITSGLRLLAMAVTFWAVLAAGTGLVAASGHCFTAAWSLAPVCGSHFWWIVVTSPEVLIFLFFMITDPKTIPGGRLARIVFAAAVGVLSTLLMAPQATEFGAKVGLLAGLVLLSPARGVFDWAVGDVPAHFWARISGAINASPRPRRVFSRGVALGSMATLLAIGIVLAGSPARPVAQAAIVAPTLETTVEIDPSSLPMVTVGEDVVALNSDVGTEGAAGLAVVLAENLAIEGEARLRSDPSLLRSVDHGFRLLMMERLIEEDAVARQRILSHYEFGALHLRAIDGESSQSGPRLGFDALGTVEVVTFDEDDTELSRTVTPFETTFVLNQATGERWLIVDEVAP